MIQSQGLNSDNQESLIVYLIETIDTLDILSNSSGEWPSGKATAFGAVTVGSNPTSPAKSRRQMEVSALILAAGSGTRMKSSKPKVMHSILGRPMIEYVLDTVNELGIQRVGLVVGYEAEDVKKALGDTYKYIPQPKQLGTGDAVMKARTHFENTPGYLLVLCGDTPLLRKETITSMIERAEKKLPSCVMLTAKVPDPHGYGRIKRDNWGNIEGIVEERDCSPEERMINEVNTGVYLFKIEDLWKAIDKISPDNDQKEYYLTDAIGILHKQDKNTLAVQSQNLEEYRGINNRWQLSQISSDMLDARLRQLCLNGITVLDPKSTYIESSVSIGQDTTIHPNTIITGNVTIGSNCEIGPFVYLIGEEKGITMGDEVKVGPFVRMRPPIEVKTKGKIGCFIDLKKSVIGRGSKIPHLSYIGDTEMGEDVNIGAGTITCNYDGKNKYKTIIGDRVFTGSDTMLIAPIKLGNDAYTGAGSVISGNVEEGDLVIERTKVRTIKGWGKRKNNARGRKDG